MPARRHIAKMRTCLNLLGLGLVVGMALVLSLGMVMAMVVAVIGPAFGAGLYQDTLAGVLALGCHAAPVAGLLKLISGGVLSPIPLSTILVLATGTVTPLLPQHLLNSLITPVRSCLAWWLQRCSLTTLTHLLRAAVLRDLHRRVIFTSPLWFLQVAYCVFAPRAPTAIR